MKSDIAFGQYCEGDSLLHRLDPRAKIVLAVLYIVVIFLAESIASFGLLLLFSARRFSVRLMRKNLWQISLP